MANSLGAIVYFVPQGKASAVANALFFDANPHGHVPETVPMSHWPLY